MLIFAISSLVVSIVSLSGMFYLLIKQHKHKAVVKKIQTSTDIDIGKCFVLGDDINSFEIKICSNGKSYTYTVKDGDLSSIKSDSMSKEFNY